MRVFAITTFLFTFFAAHSIAQNKVSVTQQGNSNSASINQSSNIAASKTTDTDCNEAHLQVTSQQNQILINRAGKDTLLYSTSKKLNLISDLLYTRELSALQYGTKNEFKIVLPDSAKSANRLEADQIGSENIVFARLTSAPDEISVSQKGEKNRIEINPCKQ